MMNIRHLLYIVCVTMVLGASTSCKSPLDYDGPEITDTTGVEPPKQNHSVEVVSSSMVANYQILLDPGHPQPLAESALVKQGYENDVVQIHAEVDTISGFELMSLEVTLDVPEERMADFYNQMQYQVSGFSFEVDSLVVQTRPITHDLNCLCEEFTMRVCRMDYNPSPHIVESEDFRPIDATMTIVKDPASVGGLNRVIVEVHMLHVIHRPGPGGDILFQAGAQFEVTYRLDE